MSYRVIFLLAGIYSLLFGTWLFMSPDSLFGILNLSPPIPDFYLMPLSLIIIVFSMLYFYAAIVPARAKNPIILGLLSKIFPSILLVYFILAENWSPKFFIMVFFNDMIWWIPFYRFIKKKKKLKPNYSSEYYEQQKN